MIFLRYMKKCRLYKCTKAQVSFDKHVHLFLQNSILILVALEKIKPFYFWLVFLLVPPLTTVQAPAAHLEHTQESLTESGFTP